MDEARCLWSPPWLCPGTKGGRDWGGGGRGAEEVCALAQGLWEPPEELSTFHSFLGVGGATSGEWMQWMLHHGRQSVNCPQEGL